MYETIGAFDWQTVLNTVESLAWVALVGVAVMLLVRSKSKLLTKQNRQVILSVFAIWALASVGLAAMNFYNYFDSRDQYIKSIEAQKSYSN